MTPRTAGLASALYPGVVTHLRLRPRRHRLRYRIFQALIDLDELEALDRLRLFSRGRFNLFGFNDADHGDGSGDLRGYVERTLADGGVDYDGGPIRILCMPRVLGYVYNPLSIYFCHRRSGALAGVLYEVNNTFGERHSYLFPIAGEGPSHRHGCDKTFYVSPFMGMDMRYGFEVEEPRERASTVIRGWDAEGLLITAAFAAERRPLTDRQLLSAFLGHPLLTLKVVAGIHWEALKLFAKGVRLTRRPPAPQRPVTLG